MGHDQKVEGCMREGSAEPCESCGLNGRCCGNHPVSLRQADGLPDDFYDSLRLFWMAARKDSRSGSAELDGGLCASGEETADGPAIFIEFAAAEAATFDGAGSSDRS